MPGLTPVNFIIALLFPDFILSYLNLRKKVFFWKKSADLQYGHSKG